jgi:hypothetical protein
MRGRASEMGEVREQGLGRFVVTVTTIPSDLPVIRPERTRFGKR